MELAASHSNTHGVDPIEARRGGECPREQGKLLGMK
jgi:hypothetical protein